jgi:two-component system sensor histidine kinase/response regulator
MGPPSRRRRSRCCRPAAIRRCARSSPPFPGLNLEQALKITNGDAGRLLKYLRRFRDEHTDEVRRVREFLQQGQHEDAVRAVHTLKGLLGTFGLAHLHGLAAELEAALRRHDDPGEPDLLTGLETELAALVTALKPLPSAAEVATPEIHVDWPALRQKLQALRGHLEGADMAGARLFEELRPALETAVGAPAHALGRQIEGIRFRDRADERESNRFAPIREA